MSSKPIPSLTDQAVQVCPYAVYKQLRDEAPVYFDALTKTWVVTRYEDIKAIALDTSRFSNETHQLLATRRDAPGAAAIARMFAEEGYVTPHVLVNSDPPRHRRYRGVVDKAFSPVRIRQIEGYIETVADELIERFAARGHVEFLSEFAVPLPMLVIADQLGVPRARSADFKRWSDSLIGAANVGNDEATQLAHTRNIIEMQNYFAAEIEKILTEPRSCILNDIANAQNEDGTLMALEERLSITQQVLVAGNETTTNTLGQAMVYLIQNRLEERLRGDPQSIPRFVEEALRLTAPLQGLPRLTTADVELHGQRIPKGSVVWLRWAAANRDEQAFDRPEEMVLDRANQTQHVTFGYGIHFCVGNQLARAELRVGFRRLIARLRNLALDGTDALAYQPHFFAFGPRQVKIRFDSPA
jgi:cytochrome P450